MSPEAKHVVELAPYRDGVKEIVGESGWERLIHTGSLLIAPNREVKVVSSKDRRRQTFLFRAEANGETVELEVEMEMYGGRDPLIPLSSDELFFPGMDNSSSDRNDHFHPGTNSRRMWKSSLNRGNLRQLRRQESRGLISGRGAKR